MGSTVTLGSGLVEPDSVVEWARQTKREAEKRAAQIRADLRLTPEAKAQDLEALIEATNGKMKEWQRKYADAVTAKRSRLERALFGYDWQSAKATDARFALEQAEAHAKDHVAFAQAVKRAQLAGDGVMLGALTYAARGSSQLRSYVPPEFAKRYQPLADFEVDHGANQDPTRKFGHTIELSNWNPVYR